MYVEEISVDRSKHFQALNDIKLENFSCYSPAHSRSVYSFVLRATGNLHFRQKYQQRRLMQIRDSEKTLNSRMLKSKWQQENCLISAVV